MTLKQLVNRIDGLSALAPSNWQAVMEGVIAGAVGQDDIPSVMHACCEAAAKQERKARRNHPLVSVRTISASKVAELADGLAARFQRLDGHESAAVRYRLFSDAMELAETADEASR